MSRWQYDLWRRFGDFFKNINKFKHTFQFICEEIEAFTYIGIEVVQGSDFSITINQNSYMSSSKLGCWYFKNW